MKVLLTLMLLPLTFASPSFAEDCGDYCATPLRKGAPAPFDGVLLSYALSTENNIRLKVNANLLEEATAYCDKRVDIEKARGVDLVAVEKQAAHDRELAILRNLEEEKKRSATLLEQANDAEMSGILWGVGGLGVGVLVGVTATVGVGVYLLLSDTTRQ